MGVIQERVDFSLIATLARQRAGMHFLIVGPVWKGAGLTPIGGLKNVHVLGAVPYREIPGILHACDVGIVPHKRDALVASMNPLKIYEFLAAGLPVITTSADDFQALRRGVSVAEDAGAFLRALDASCATAPHRDELRALVADMSWKKRFTLMWDIVQQTLARRERSSGA